MWPLCGSQCPGMKDAMHHGAECVVLALGAGPVLSKLGGSYYRYPALILLRCLVMQRKSPKKWQKLMDMRCDKDDHNENSPAYRETKDNVDYLEAQFLKIVHAMEEQSQTRILSNTSVQLLHKISGILKTNALSFGLTCGLTLTAVYPTVSVIEHSCIANVRYEFSATSSDPAKRFRLSVRAAKDIKQGEHIAMAYTNILCGTVQRLQLLRETRNLGCGCERCRDPTELGTYFSAVLCECGGRQLPAEPLNLASEWVCDKCCRRAAGTAVNSVVLDAIMHNERLLGDLTDVAKLEELMLKLSKVLDGGHFVMYSIKHGLVLRYGNQDCRPYEKLPDELLERKIAMCRDLLGVNFKLDPSQTSIALNSASLFYELHKSVLEFANRKFRSDDDLDSLVKYLKEVGECLKKCKELIVHELESPLGSALNTKVDESTAKLKKYATEKKLVF